MNIYKSFTHKMAAKPAGIDMERNYATVALCIVYYTSVDRNAPTQLLRSVVDSLYHRVPAVVQQMTRFRLTQRVARSVCGSRASIPLRSGSGNDWFIAVTTWSTFPSGGVSCHVHVELTTQPPSLFVASTQPCRSKPTPVSYQNWHFTTMYATTVCLRLLLLSLLIILQLTHKTLNATCPLSKTWSKEVRVQNSTA